MSNTQIAPENDSLIPIKKFGEEVGLDLRTVYRMIDDGDIPKPIKQRGKNYYFRSDLMNYQQALKLQRS